MNVPGTDIEKPTVQLTGDNGNAGFVIGKCQKALRRAGVPKSVIDEFLTKATSGNYDNVLTTAMEYCEVE